MEIRTIRSIEGLEKVRACWEGWQNHPNSDFDHFNLYCQIHQENVCPHVTVVECNGQTRFLLVGRLEQTFFVPSIGYFRPVRIPARVLMVLRQGLLGQESEEIAEALVRYLWSLLKSGEADAVSFHHLPEHSPLLRILLSDGPRWWCENRPVWSTNWSMRLSEEPGALLKKISSKHRSWIRKKLRELESAFPSRVSWRWMTNFNDIPDLCKCLERVASRTYQRGLGAGFSNNEECRQRFALYANSGRLRVLILEIDGEAQAFWIGEVYRGVFHSSATGYNPDLRKHEPGTLLFMRMVDELAQEGVRHLDFGLGDALYKSRFGDQSWREATMRLFAPTVKGFALRSSLGFSSLLDDVGRHLLQKVGGIDRLKTGWRRHLSASKLKDEEE